MNRRIIIVLLLCAAVFLTSCTSTAQKSDTAPPEGTDGAAENGIVNYPDEYDDSDLVLELTPEDFIDRDKNLFVFPNIEWETPYTEIPAKLGVTEVNDYPEDDPVMWAKLNYGKGEILCIPYLGSHTGESGMMQFELLIEEWDDVLLEGMTEKADDIIAAFTDCYGEPTSVTVDEEQHNKGAMEVHEYRWDMQVESGFNTMRLIIGYYGDDVYMLDVLCGNRT
jgi:hypothetical protein